MAEFRMLEFSINLINVIQKLSEVLDIKETSHFHTPLPIKQTELEEMNSISQNSFLVSLINVEYTASNVAVAT